jgi:predicted DNA-binding transcriptional regulator AlpA
MRTHANHKFDRGDLGDQVLTFHEWCELNGISHSTGERLRKAGQGPRFVQLSARRIGVRVRDNAAWQESRLQRS